MAALHRNCRLDIIDELATEGNLEHLTIFILISGKTKALFAQLIFRYSFLHVPPNEWLENKDSISRQRIVTDLKVANDSAERGAVFMH